MAAGSDARRRWRLARRARRTSVRRSQHLSPSRRRRPPIRTGFRRRPADTLDRGPWWRLFGDPGLDALAEQVEVSNQNVAAAVAAYAQAQALVRERRAALFPSLALDGSATRAGGAGSPGTRNSLRLDLGASWEPDIWGQLRLAVTECRRRAPRRALPTWRRRACRRRPPWRPTTSHCARPTTRSRCSPGRSRPTSARCASRRTATTKASPSAPTCSQAQTQLDTTRANLRATVGQRAVLEHAIAVLVGKAPAEFSVPVARLERHRSGGAADGAVGAVAAPARHRRGRARGGGRERADRHPAVGLFSEPQPFGVLRRRRHEPARVCSGRRTLSGRWGCRRRRRCSTPVRSRPA